MSVSTIRRPTEAPAPAPRCSPDAGLVEFEVALPPSLAAFGPTVRASLCGEAGAPVVVALGGISAERFPCFRPGGQAGWWPGLAGPGCAIDPADFRILGLDFAADESGRIAPTTRDQAAVICAALDAIRVHQARAIVGASYGGMAALALAEHFPDRAERLVVASAGAEPHPAATAIRELQRRVVALAIANGTGEEGLSIARGLAMLTYRTPAEFEARFAGGIAEADVLSCSEPGAYLRARGDAYRTVMSPQRFLSLSASIDRHRVDPSRIKHRCLVIGASTDQLVLSSQLESLARRLAGPAELALLPSLFGHDMFLKDASVLSDLAAPFLRQRA
jgi:homoserine O-acetyltransferase